MLRVEAHAKVNRSLEITGRRSDGFHELVSVMQEVELADTLTFSPCAGIVVRSSDPSLDGPTNLVFRAAQLLRSRYGVESGCHIQLQKNIPVSAGLGGGSSDAAATLRGLSEMWELRLGCDDMIVHAEELGSDVPFFLYGGTALVTGRGEHVMPMRVSDPIWYLLMNPKIAVSTAAIFRDLRATEWTSGKRTRAVACDMTSHGGAQPGPNALANALFRTVPEAWKCFRRLQHIAPHTTFVSGSGSTVGAMFASEDDALRAKASVEQFGYWTAVTRSYIPGIGTMPCP